MADETKTVENTAPDATVAGETVETAETVEETTSETPETVVEEVAETPETAETVAKEGDEAQGDAAVAETATEDAEEGETEGETAEEVAETVELAPLEFSEESAPAEILEKLTERYELPEDVAKAIFLLTEKASKAPEMPAVIPELEDFGDTKAVITTLEAYNNLVSSRIENDTNRKNTDKFVAKLIEESPESADWLAYDLLRQPSLKYPGRTRWEEANINALAKEGDTVETVMRRFEAWKHHVLEGADVPDSAIPDFIPANVRQAYKELSEASREALKYLDPADEYDVATINAKIGELEKIQEGIVARAEKAEATKQAQSAALEQYNNAIYETQTRFYAEARKQAVGAMVAEGMTKLEAAQRVALLEQAFDTSSAGDFAREALKSEGINFNKVTAQQLINNVRDAAVAVTDAARMKDASGSPLNDVQLKRAKRAFDEASREWNTFAQDIIRQQNTKITPQAVKREQAKEAVKQKIAMKTARPAVKTVGTGAQGKSNVPPYGTPEYFSYWADQELSAAAARVKVYQE